MAVAAESKPADVEKIVNGEAPSFAATAANGEQNDVDLSKPSTPRRFSLMHRKSTSTDDTKIDVTGDDHDGLDEGAQIAQQQDSKEESFVHVNGNTTASQPADDDKLTGEKSSTDEKGSGRETAPVSEGEKYITYAEAVKEGEDAKRDDWTPPPADGEKAVAAIAEQVDQPNSERKESKVGKTKKRVSYAEATKKSPEEINDNDSEESYPPLDDRNQEAINYRHENVSPGPGGIRWAPLKVPAKRRLQTLMVLLHCLCILSLVSLFFLSCANPFLWPLLIPYLIHILISKAATDGSLRYRSEWFRRLFIWKWFCDYFPAQLHKTADLPPTRKYIFGYHPHGIISHGAWAAFATDALGFSEKFPGITNSLLTLDSNFRLPFYRDYVFAMGIRSVSKESITNILTRGGPNREGMGRAVTIVVGGARESLEAQPGRLRLVLKERKGFIKLAIRTGADLVPVLAFGENELYDQLQPKAHPVVHKIQMFILKVWKFTLPFMHGRGIFNYDVGLMPYRHPMNIVVGAPIKVMQATSVDLAEVNRLHDAYVAELENLWDRYKDEFAPDRKEEMQIT